MFSQSPEQDQTLKYFSVVDQWNKLPEKNIAVSNSIELQMIRP